MNRRARRSFGEECEGMDDEEDSSSEEEEEEEPEKSDKGDGSEDGEAPAQGLFPPTPATHAILANLKAGETVYQAGELSKTLRVSKTH